MRLSHLIAAALVGAALAGSALAQGFPLMTFGQLGQMDEQIAARQKKTGARPGDLMFNPGENGGARVRATYTGKSRDLSARNQAFIISFASSSVGNSGYAKLYDREYLFKEGAKEVWLPVQNQVASYFAKELKAGQTVTLYVRNAGGFRLSDSWDWMFLVEEFDTPGGAPDKAPAPGPAPKGGNKAIPPGPKTAV